ncbi:DEAD/DEAH box helicase, partial [uncultured Brevundimonas sp.]|uniref:DEAD/DEAH box helicase n=1 Tax=uncultured Brevundimonas sp. TaxID=213418 RepID=UPI0025CC01CD
MRTSASERRSVSNITFESMGLNKALLQALASTGYEKPTPIQAKAIPDVMLGKDLLGIAQTGTGKTAAFALPILHRLAENRVPPQPRTTRALILSPTRELATQIADSFKQYGAHLGFRVAVIFGGVKYGPQERALQQGLDVLVAAPGRLLDHLQQKTLDLSSTEIFVLDEADQMLDLGF